MNVELTLRRTAIGDPAAGLLLLTRDPRAVLGAFTPGDVPGAGADPVGGAPARPEVFDVGGGFLIRGPFAVRPAVMSVRLREPFPGLYIPVDAELLPALHPDEARGLLRGRGLILLPEPADRPAVRAVSFDPARPVPPGAILDVGPVTRRPWDALPVPDPLADRLTEVIGPPPGVPDLVLEAGGESVGEEEPRPASSGTPGKILGGAAFKAGQGLVWLGKALNLSGLAGLGANLINQALHHAPRLAESVLGRQEAALRELLRQFRAGDLENALRRALPIGGGTDRGGSAAADARLPLHNLKYSLGDILGSGGTPSVWFGGFDVQAELAKEYRKAAEQAVARGDYRRAAFIYGKLLADYRQAAVTLARAGLHRDAAAIFLTKLDDVRAAAREFEAAGETDRALDLFRQREWYEDAGDLLRRAGDEEAALVEYRRAAEQRLRSQGGCLAAGDLISQKTGRADIAREYWAAGWKKRPEPNAMPCAMRLLGSYADAAAVADLRHLIGEAEVLCYPEGNDMAAAEFFNELARRADAPRLAEARDEFRDRALMGIANKLRQRAGNEFRAGTVVSEYMGQASPWAAAVVTDAGVAVKAAVAATDRGRPVDGTSTRVQVGSGLVTAACIAPTSGDLFIGLADGDVRWFRPATGSVGAIGAGNGPVTGVVADANGGVIVVARRHQGDRPSHTLFGYRCDRTGAFSYAPLSLGSDVCSIGLTMNDDHGPCVGVWDGTGLHVLRAPMLTAARRADGASNYFVGMPVTVLIRPFLSSVRTSGATAPVAHVLYLAQETVCHEVLGTPGTDLSLRTLGWTPAPPPGSELASPVVTWLPTNVDEIQLAGLGETGTLYWSKLGIGDDGVRDLTTLAFPGQHGFLAAAIIRTGFLAGISRSHVHWLRVGTGGLVEVSRSTVGMGKPVACFAAHPTNELLIVDADGSVLRVPISR